LKIQSQKEIIEFKLIKTAGYVVHAKVNRTAVILGDISERNTVFFEEEMEKLDRWAEDKRKSLKGTLKDYDDQIADLKKQSRVAPNLPEKLAIQKKIRNLDKKRDEAWREYDEGARGIERQKDSLIDGVEARLQQEIEEENLFTVRWKLV
jgi:DNA repair ATPase RecN